MRLVLAILVTTVLTVVLLVPDPFALIGIVRQETRDAVEDVFSDKVQHALSYAVLSMAIAFAVRGPRGRTCLWAGGLAIAHGAASELLQSFVPDRSCDWKDFVADAVGVACGLGIWNAGLLWPTARRERPLSPELPAS